METDKIDPAICEEEIEKQQEQRRLEEKERRISERSNTPEKDDFIVKVNVAAMKQTVYKDPKTRLKDKILRSFNLRKALKPSNANQTTSSKEDKSSRFQHIVNDALDANSKTKKLPTSIPKKGNHKKVIRKPSKNKVITKAKTNNGVKSKTEKKNNG